MLINHAVNTDPDFALFTNTSIQANTFSMVIKYPPGDDYCNSDFCLINTNSDCSGYYCDFIKELKETLGIKTLSFESCKSPTGQITVWEQCLSEISSADLATTSKGYMLGVPIMQSPTLSTTYNVNFAYPLQIDSMYFMSEALFMNKTYLAFLPFSISAWSISILLTTIGAFLYWLVERGNNEDQVPKGKSTPWILYSLWILNMRSLMRNGQLWAGGPVGPKTLPGYIIALTNAIYTLGFTSMYVSNLAAFLIKGTPVLMYSNPNMIKPVYDYRLVDHPNGNFEKYKLCVPSDTLPLYALKYQGVGNIILKGLDMNKFQKKDLSSVTSKNCAGIMMGYNGFYDEARKYDFGMCNYYKTSFTDIIVKYAFPIGKRWGFNIDYGMVKLLESGYTTRFQKQLYKVKGKCKNLNDSSSASFTIPDGVSLYYIFVLGYLISLVFVFASFMRGRYNFATENKREEREILKSKIRSRIRRLFDILDKDRSNYLDKEELTILLEKLDPEVKTNAEKMDLYMHQMDSDGSGSIEFEEFLEAFINMRKTELRKKNPSKFEYLVNEDDEDEEEDEFNDNRGQGKTNV